MRRLEPVTPGELLLEEFLKLMGISRYGLAKEIGVPAQRIGEIVAGRRAITADSDLRLCRFFGLSNGYWLRAQAAHDTEVAERTLRAKLATIRPWTQKAGEKRRAASRSKPVFSNIESVMAYRRASSRREGTVVAEVKRRRNRGHHPRDEGDSPVVRVSDVEMRRTPSADGGTVPFVLDVALRRSGAASPAWTKG